MTVLLRAFGLGLTIRVEGKEVVVRNQIDAGIAPEIIAAIRVEKPAIIDALSPCPSEYPNPLAWYVVGVLLYDEAAELRDQAVIRTDLHTAATELCYLLMQYDNALWKSDEEGNEWAQMYCGRFRELSERALSPDEQVNSFRHLCEVVLSGVDRRNPVIPPGAGFLAPAHVPLTRESGGLG